MRAGGPRVCSRMATGSCCWRSGRRSLLFAAIAQNFFTLGNFFEVIRLSVELGLLAIALTPVIVSGGIDLSVGSMMGLAAVLLWRGVSRLGAAAAGGRGVWRWRRVRRRRPERAFSSRVSISRR